MALTKFEQLQKQLSDIKLKLELTSAFIDGVLSNERKKEYFSELHNPYLYIQEDIKKLIESINSDDLKKVYFDDSDTLLKSFLTVRTFKILQENDICTLSSLIDCSIRDLYKFPRFGRKSLTEIQYFLADYGLTLREQNNAD